MTKRFAARAKPDVQSAGHDIIVIGASAGGLKALSAVLGPLPANLEAAIFVVQHLAADRKSYLPQLLGDVTDLPVTSPRDGEVFRRGHIYVAAPDHHLLLAAERVRAVRGPKENRFRPSVDTLFRSAARCYGPRVIGLVLTGYLDDGTVGLQTIKKRGGIAIVQDPLEAEYPSMPTTALRYLKVDHVVRTADAGSLLVRLVEEPHADEGDFPTTTALEIESEIAEQNMNTKQFLESVERIGTRTPYTCPECNGSIWEIGENEPLKLRCHVGHSFTGESFSAEQNRNMETALWTAIRVMEEKITFSRKLAQRRERQQRHAAAEAYENEATMLDAEVTRLRDFLVTGVAKTARVHDVHDEM